MSRILDGCKPALSAHGHSLSTKHAYNLVKLKWLRESRLLWNGYLSSELALDNQINDQVFCSPWVSRTQFNLSKGCRWTEHATNLSSVRTETRTLMPFQNLLILENEKIIFKTCRYNQNLSNFKSFILKCNGELNSTRLIWGMSLQLYFIKLPSCFVLKGILEKINPSPDQKWRCSSRKRKSISSTHL